MTDSVIKVKDIGKWYPKKRKNTSILHEILWEPLKTPIKFAKKKLGKTSSKQAGFWALDSISFEVNRGESLGIIGANGAGKSTLLKILSRIITPTEGQAVIRGRVNSLLEVGTGFQKSLTGRENIYLNSSIMGMSHTETEGVIEEIIDFSGVRDFIDIPVKLYSSGMYSRLAFAVAAHTKGEILLIDEVLSVGDAEFQKKSLRRMSGLLTEGRTVLFVSHNLGSILKFCDKVLWLDHGNAIMYGESEQVVQAYLDKSNKLFSSWENDSNNQENKDNYLEESAGHNLDLNDKFVELLKFKVSNNRESDNNIFYIDEDIIVEISFSVHNSGLQMVPQFHVISDSRHAQPDETHAFTSYYYKNKINKCGIYDCKVIIPKNLLNNGKYFLSVAIVTPSSPIERHIKIEKALSFRVFDSPTSKKVFGGEIRGSVRPKLEWDVKQVLE